jgi:acetyl esterase/lipase
MVGTMDPLHDDSWRFMKRLYDLNNDVRMTVYDLMPHGFWSYDTPQGLKQARLTIDDAIVYLKELLGI